MNNWKTDWKVLAVLNKHGRVVKTVSGSNPRCFYFQGQHEMDALCEAVAQSSESKFTDAEKEMIRNEIDSAERDSRLGWAKGLKNILDKMNTP